MKTQSILFAALAAAPTVMSHTVWSVLYVDGESQGDAAGIRMRKDPAKASFPLVDYSSDDMACNVDGTKGVNFVNPVKDGSTLTFEMRSWPDDPSKQPLDRPHHGPCAVYLKKVASAIDDKGAGDGWFKLMDDGYHADTDTWCTDRLIDNKGRLSVELPKGLEGGYYLARPEVVALHNATDGQAQFYAGCAQIFLESTGNLVPESTIAIPGPEYVTDGQSSVKFNIYLGKNAEYQVPGPAVANFTHTANLASDAQLQQTEGLVPSSCVAQNANWCAKEVASYSDETGCWASGEDCWKQGEVCWAEAPPTGGKVCQLWNDKCQAINDQCKAKNFNGPPNKGKILTPKRETIDIGLIIKPVGGGIIESDSTAPKSSAAVSKSSAAVPKSSAPPAFTSAPALAPSAYEPKSDAIETPAPSSTVASFIETPSFSSTVSLLSFEGGAYGDASPSTSTIKVAKPAVTSTVKVPASEYAVAPTPTPVAAEAVDENGVKYKVEVVTETQYVTVTAGGYKHRVHRRH
ncbi:lytic polysaccharide monooxygenase [Karstenula rhodostoma CBS 690.94]|uniref:AA9 family lytic polysaccharide monooxygenase n=1 Tax=Karstenula rhodostoma CBS 690.94 TaxID=1392251 RepID=A0A9P4UGL1_9PLEO|nr:lytic polysaccharide monooxygenase [Karstenula rhodostoma CBS 690.94]